MRDLVEKIINEQRTAGFPALSGTRVSGSIPVPEPLVNDIAREKAPRNVRVERIAFLPGNRIVVEANVPIAIFRKSVQIELILPELVDVAENPVMQIRVLGGLAFIGEIVANLLGKLPEGVTFTGGIVSVNLRTMLQKDGNADLLAYLRRLTFVSDRGVLFVGFAVKID
jgi:hypothetical protein